MNAPDEIIVKRVLNNKGTAKEAETVAAWLATEDGQSWLMSALETDSDIQHTSLSISFLS